MTLETEKYREILAKSQERYNKSVAQQHKFNRAMDIARSMILVYVKRLEILQNNF